MSSFSRPLCFPSSPRTMNPGHIRVSLTNPWGHSCPRTYQRSLSTPKCIVTFPSARNACQSEVRNLPSEVIKVWVPRCPQPPGRILFCLPGTNQHPRTDDHSSNRALLATSGGFHPTVMLTPPVGGGGVPCLYLNSFGAYPNPLLNGPVLSPSHDKRGSSTICGREVRGNHLPQCPYSLRFPAQVGML